MNETNVNNYGIGNYFDNYVFKSIKMEFYDEFINLSDYEIQYLYIKLKSLYEKDDSYNWDKIENLLLSELRELKIKKLYE